MQIQENYPLSKLTTFGLGGPADFYVEVERISELHEALDFAHLKKLPVFVIGGGSNVLVSDDGFRGLVIRNHIPSLDVEDSGMVWIGAGENWDMVVATSIEKNLAGIECLSGVPGSAGGAVVQNIGAYGQTLGDIVEKVHTIEVATGKEKEFLVNDCEFEYRSSYFKKNPNKYVVTKFLIKLLPNGQPNISYPHVRKNFEKKSKPSLSDVREFIIKLRASKGYVIMPGYDCFLTAGSFFKNPIITQEQFEKLAPMLGDESLNRFWPASTSHDEVGRGGKTPKGVKLAAAFLMESAGFGKGYQDGNVGISPKHSLSLINLGNASASEVKDLAKKIKGVVLEKFGVELEEEVLYVQ